MSTESKTVALTPIQWTTLKGLVADAGFTIGADQGSASKDMTDVSWNYNGSALTVTTSGIFSDRAMHMISAKIAVVMGAQ